MNSAPFKLQPITATDADAIAHIIRSVGAEFGATGAGFGPGDAEVAAMHRHYGHDGRSLYLVALIDDRVVGGGGLAPLPGAAGTCELKKLFLLPEARGRGIGRAISQQCLAFARQAGFNQCYLDTLASMTSAIALYRSLGFRELQQPLAASEHSGCDIWMVRDL